MISSQIPDLTPLTDNERKLTAAVEKTQAILERLHAENESLRAELDERRKYEDMLCHKFATLEVAETSPDVLGAPMMRALQKLYHDEVDFSDLGVSAAAFCLLLEELEVHHD